MAPVYGVISDDFTGGLLIASYFEEAGLECPVFFSAQAAIQAAPVSAPIVVIATRARLVPVFDATALLNEALDALDTLGCATVCYKACASFDSTEEGNIGLAAEMLSERYHQTPMLLSAGFPEFRCTVSMGHLFYQSVLVSESVKRFDPVTPMSDPNLVRFLSRQTRTPLGHVSHLELVKGEAVARRALESEAAKGHRHILLDCTDRERQCKSWPRKWRDNLAAGRVKLCHFGPFCLQGGRGYFQRGTLQEGPPRASGRHERTGGRWPFRDFACEREEDDDVFGPAGVSAHGADQAAQAGRVHRLHRSMDARRSEASP